ncbi:MAG: UbiA family prenyltransferase [Ferruginibacter sp.]
MHSILLLISIVIPVLSLFVYPAITREIFSDLRFLRILHYVALALLGFALYFSNQDLAPYFSQQQQWLVFPLFIIALVYAAVFAIITNNIADIETDKISNTERPLIKRTVKQGPYLLAGVLCLAYSLILSLLVNSTMFYCIVIISAGYYIYSCKPFRLKRIPFIAKLLIGFNSLVVAVCGFVLAGGSLVDFPVIWAVFIVLPLSLAANFVDLKDTAGDGKTGIKTLPVMLGESRAIHLIAFFTVCTYLMAAVIINLIWVYPMCGIMTVLHIVLLYRKPYNEKPIFLIYISALFGLNIILLFNKYLA